VPRVLLLDPAYPESVTPGFLRHATESAGWDMDRPPLLRMGSNVAPWLADFEKCFADAQVIISLGDFTALLQWGDRLDQALALLRKKIDEGAPLVLSGACSLAATYPPETFGADQSQIRDLIGSYGIHITPITVASHIREMQTIASQMCCVFRSEDDALIDPQLFDGVDMLVAVGNHLIAYEPGVFPIVEACRAIHFFVDEGDMIHRGNLGQRNAVAVIQRLNGRGLIIAVTGRVLGDREQVIAGIVPGWDDNKTFGNNLIRFLTDYVRDRSPYAPVKLYELFSELETRLGRLIQSVLVSHSVYSDFSGLIPENVRNKLQTPSGFDYGRATYIDLVVILRHQLIKFAHLFSLAGDDVLKLLFEINSGQRVHLAHPHKAAQLGVTFSADDAEALRRALELVRRASARLSA
jgi:hypothetical protein